MLSRIATILALMLPGLSGVGAARAYAQLPPGFSVASSAQVLQLNGAAVLSRAISSDLAPLQACEVLERQWRRAVRMELPAACRREGDWLLLTHRSGGLLQTVQLHETGSGSGSFGYLSEFDPLAPMAARPVPHLPLPSGARVVNVVQSLEQGDSVTQFTVVLPVSPTTALARLQIGARALGWAGAALAGGNVTEFQRGSIAIRAIAVPMSRGSALVLIEHQAMKAGP